MYRGLPSSMRDPKGYAACRRQMATWESSDAVAVTTRSLQYLDADEPGQRPSVREKGIDVALAIDVATLAAERAYDVAIVFSLDTDLHPAFEYVLEKQRAWGRPRIEAAAWTAPGLVNRRLAISGQRMYCHWVGQDTYDRVRDDRDYTKG